MRTVFAVTIAMSAIQQHYVFWMANYYSLLHALGLFAAAPADVAWVERGLSATAPLFSSILVAIPLIVGRLLFSQFV